MMRRDQIIFVIWWRSYRDSMQINFSRSFLRRSFSHFLESYGEVFAYKVLIAEVLLIGMTNSEILDLFPPKLALICTWSRYCIWQNLPTCFGLKSKTN